MVVIEAVPGIEENGDKKEKSVSSGGYHSGSGVRW